MKALGRQKESLILKPVSVGSLSSYNALSGLTKVKSSLLIQCCEKMFIPIQIFLFLHIFKT